MKTPGAFTIYRFEISLDSFSDCPLADRSVAVFAEMAAPSEDLPRKTRAGLL